jgi:hypothetical protein
LLVGDLEAPVRRLASRGEFEIHLGQQGVLAQHSEERVRGNRRRFLGVVANRRHVRQRTGGPLCIRTQPAGQHHRTRPRLLLRSGDLVRGLRVDCLSGAHLTGISPTGGDAGFQRCGLQAHFLRKGAPQLRRA